MTQTSTYTLTSYLILSEVVLLEKGGWPSDIIWWLKRVIRCVELFFIGVCYFFFLAFQINDIYNINFINCQVNEL